MNNRCGGGQYFQKLKNFVGDSGLCEFYDSRTKSDYGQMCQKFKPLKYERKKFWSFL